jgi:hypothetical protein
VALNIRTTRSSVTFAAPFSLGGIDGVQRPGRYQVETEEEKIEGHLHTLYRRVATILYLPRGGTTSGYTVDPEELAAAERADRLQNSSPETEQEQP